MGYISSKASLRGRAVQKNYAHDKEIFGFMDTFERIREFLAEQLSIDDVESITMDSDIMKDFDADSLDLVDMVMTLEDEFGIEVPDEAIAEMHTVGDVVRYVDANKD